MSDNSNIFRSAVMGGFNRQDVLTYIESRARTHTEELNELGRRLDQSQKELNETRELLVQSNASLKEAQTASDSYNEELEQATLELRQLRAEFKELTASSSAKSDELAAVRLERDQLARKIGEMRAQLEDIEQAKIRVANIELEAYARAKKIEDSAIENTNMARAALTNLFQDAKRRFDLTKEDASLTVLRVSQELERLKEVLRHLPDSFDAISSDIEALKFGTEKKVAGTFTEASAEIETPADTDIQADTVMQYDSLVYPDSEQTEDDTAPHDDTAPFDDTAPYIEVLSDDLAETSSEPEDSEASDTYEDE